MEAELEKLFNSQSVRCFGKVRELLTAIAEDVGGDQQGPVNRFMIDIERWAVAGKLGSLQKMAGIDTDYIS